MVREREAGAWMMGVEVFGEGGDVDGEVKGGCGEVSFLVDKIL